MTALGNDVAAPALVLVATPIGNMDDLSPRALDVLTTADSVACEDTRRTGSLFAHFGIAHSPFIVCNEHTEQAAAEEILRRIESGQMVALVSDAGTPAVSDPGYRVAQRVIAAGHDVRSIPGPSALLVGLTVSGLATDRFCFDGFLPRKGAERGRRLERLEREDRTTVLFEAPHRLQRTIDDLEGHLGPDRRIALARELTKRYEEVWRGTLADAVKHVADVEPRGEYVIILEGAPVHEASDENVIEALQRELRSGASRRDAISTVVDLTGAKKRQVYDLALRLDGKTFWRLRRAAEYLRAVGASTFASNLTALVLGQAAPDPRVLIGHERVFEALPLHGAGRTHLLCVLDVGDRRTGLTDREEEIRVGISACSAIAPHSRFH